jgi:hypothetical protein
MKQTFLNAFLILFMVRPAVVHAGEVREIVLSDNSIIVGELVSLEKGIYKIKTKSLGLLAVEEEKIKRIGSKSDRMSGQVEESGQKEIFAIQQRMIADGSVMQQLQDLEKDPDFQEILQDEAVMQAINSGDLNALMTNPKIMKLMEKSSVQEIKMNLK